MEALNHFPAFSDIEDNNLKRKSNQVYCTVPHTRHSKSMDHLVGYGESNEFDRSLMIQFSYPPASYYNFQNHHPFTETESYAPSNGYIVYSYASNQGYVSTLPLPGLRSSKDPRKLDR